MFLGPHSHWADVSILRWLSLCTYLLETHLPVDWYPLKYLWGVRSLLCPSQAEQLLSGPEKRMDRRRLPPSNRPCGIRSHDPRMVECVPTVVRRSPRVQGASSLWSFSDPFSGPPNLLACVITKPRSLYPMKTVTIQQNKWQITTSLSTSTISSLPRTYVSLNVSNSRSAKRRRIFRETITMSYRHSPTLVCVTHALK